LATPADRILAKASSGEIPKTGTMFARGVRKKALVKLLAGLAFGAGAKYRKQAATAAVITHKTCIRVWDKSGTN